MYDILAPSLAILLPLLCFSASLRGGWRSTSKTVRSCLHPAAEALLQPPERPLAPADVGILNYRHFGGALTARHGRMGGW